MFNSVIRAVAGAPTDHAARDQAASLTSLGGTVEVVSADHLTRGVLSDAGGYDLVVVGGGAAAFRALEQARIPVLIARPCPLGIDVMDTIVVPVDGSPESSGALDLAGSLAGARGGTVTLLAAPRIDLTFQRAITSSCDALLRATGLAPHVIGAPRPPEVIIPSAAATLRASLVVLHAGRDPTERRMARLMVAAIGCSVLVLPRS